MIDPLTDASRFTVRGDLPPRDEVQSLRVKHSSPCGVAVGTCWMCDKRFQIGQPMTQWEGHWSHAACLPDSVFVLLERG